MTQVNWILSHNRAYAKDRRFCIIGSKRRSAGRASNTMYKESEFVSFLTLGLKAKQSSNIEFYSCANWCASLFSLVS
jgi:hypothetical protein